MAQLQSTSITGSFFVGTTPSVVTAGTIWYNTSICKLQYAYCNGSSIVCCTL